MFVPKKPSTSKERSKVSKSQQAIPQAAAQVERQSLRDGDIPVVLSDEENDDDDDDDCVTITSTWRTRNSKAIPATPCLDASPHPLSTPKSNRAKPSTWISSEEEEEVESLLDRLKRTLLLNSVTPSVSKTKSVSTPVAKPKPCVSDPAVKGKVKTKVHSKKEEGGDNTPVQPPKFHPPCFTEPKEVHRSRIDGCKVPGCFLQSLSDPKSNYCRNFKQKKEELTSKLYCLYNTSVFENKLPADLSVSWCNKMRKTAGFCITGQERITKQRYARIRLSVKVCDSADRLRDTLVHEMCHAAPWLIHGVRDGHGPIWKMFARKAMLAHPELPMVSRCHSYDIKYKFQYQCTRCKNTIGRHSKSLDTQRFVCALCKGQLELLTPSGSRGPTPFAIYVKENYKTARQQLTGQSHGDVMRKLSADFASKTRLSAS